MARATFRRIPQKRELVEAFFELCGGERLIVFAVIMWKPTQQIPDDSPFLPNQFRYLLQRVNAAASLEKDQAIVLFDGNGSQFGGLPPRFESYLFRSREGRSLVNIADSPYYVDSKTTAGIQITDMVASVVRQYHENELHRGVPTGDAYLSAIARYHRTISDLSKDVAHPDGSDLFGMYRMPERDHYQLDRASEEQDNGDPLKPENQT